MRASFAYGGEEQVPCRPPDRFADREKPRDFAKMETQRLPAPTPRVNDETRMAQEREETLCDEGQEELENDRSVGEAFLVVRGRRTLGKPRLSRTVTGITEATRRLRQSGFQSSARGEGMREQREEPRPLSEIALEIQKEWRRLNYAAVTPVAAMQHLRHIDDRYGGHRARAVVRDFLGCSVSWTGPAARRIKAELVDLLGDPRRE